MYISEESGHFVYIAMYISEELDNFVYIAMYISEELDNFVYIATLCILMHWFLLILCLPLHF